MNKLSDAAVARIPLFLRLHNLLTFAKLIRTIGNGPIQNEAVWVTDLRHRLTKKCVEYRDQFQNYPVSHVVE